MNLKQKIYYAILNGATVRIKGFEDTWRLDCPPDASCSTGKYCLFDLGKEESCFLIVKELTLPSAIKNKDRLKALIQETILENPGLFFVREIILL